MNFFDIIQRMPTPAPWAEGDKIPWNDPDFSRRIAIIEEHVEWIHREVLHNRSSRVLDLGCAAAYSGNR